MANNENKLNIHQSLRHMQLNFKMEKNAKGSKSVGEAKYRDIEGIMSKANSIMAGLDVFLWRSDSLEAIGDRIFVRVECCLVDMNGEKSMTFVGLCEIEDEMLSNKGKPIKDKPQRTGAASTYAHRRALSNLFAIDDGSLDPDKPIEVVEDIINGIDEATGPQQLKVIGSKIKKLGLSDSQSQEIRRLYKEKKAELEEKEPKQSQPKQHEMDESLL